MKSKIHPTYINNTVVTCNSCSTVFNSGSVLDEIRVEICSNCHPFYTGKAKMVDTENLVKKFEDKLKQVNTQRVQSKKEKQSVRNRKSTEIKAGSGLTLRDMLKQIG
jgi:large subunit ribosomal protein L31